jgi:hypothetical protein
MKRSLSKNGKMVNVLDSPAYQALIPEMVKRSKPVVLSASLRPIK